jgi:hypothetical protein
MQLGSSKDRFPCFTRLNPCVAHCSMDSIPWVLTLKGRRIPWLRRGICPLANPYELWYDNQPSTDPKLQPLPNSYRPRGGERPTNLRPPDLTHKPKKTPKISIEYHRKDTNWKITNGYQKPRQTLETKFPSKGKLPLNRSQLEKLKLGKEGAKKRSKPKWKEEAKHNPKTRQAQSHKGSSKHATQCIDNTN